MIKVRNTSQGRFKDQVQHMGRFGYAIDDQNADSGGRIGLKGMQEGFLQGIPLQRPQHEGLDADDHHGCHEKR